MPISVRSGAFSTTLGMAASSAPGPAAPSGAAAGTCRDAFTAAELTAGASGSGAGAGSCAERDTTGKQPGRVCGSSGGRSGGLSAGLSWWQVAWKAASSSAEISRRSEIRLLSSSLVCTRAPSTAFRSAAPPPHLCKRATVDLSVVSCTGITPSFDFLLGSALQRRSTATKSTRALAVASKRAVSPIVSLRCKSTQRVSILRTTS
mmetsp:Transcript_48670/g.130275  ORF Transcript_48670/g.130275 Transcript_48670/m.130275 type:complete len:205 (-) Transcript_48670:852-1466(-)